MAVTESSVTAPPPGWGRRFPRDEKLFFVVIVATTALMTAFAIGWVLWSGHNVPRATERTTPAAFSAQVQAFAKKYADGEGRAWVPPGTDAYMLATRYSWYPELVLQAGQEYRIWISSGDVLHGFSLVGGTQNLNLEIAPNHSFGVRLTPDDPGRYRIICNEYCGLGHQEMTSFLTVVPPAEMSQHVADAGTTTGGTGSGGSGTSDGALKIEADPGGALAYNVAVLTAEAGKVVITMSNPSPLPHNVAIKGAGVDVKGPVVFKNGTSTVSADLQNGIYTFYCSVPGHEAAGMKGTLVVK
jgi:cytochrome c oxidase subunit 2